MQYFLTGVWVAYAFFSVLFQTLAIMVGAALPFIVIWWLLRSFITLFTGA